jgi:FdhD protein
VNSLADAQAVAGADVSDEALPAPLRQRPVLRIGGAAREAVLDAILDEVPVALAYNGISHAVMMATPADLDDFALGFSLSEGILPDARQCYGIEVETAPEGVTVHLDVAAGAFAALKARRRALAGHTGCGLCGVDSLRAVRRPLTPVAGSDLRVTPDVVARALAAIKGRQPLTAQTGAAHAAAWCGLDGSLAIVREDVGRHNALDKVVGAMAHAGVRPDGADAGFLLLTSRVSLEMAQKAMVAGIAVVVGMSAPTLAAVELADAAGMTLLAFARGDGFVCYTHARRLA